VHTDVRRGYDDHAPGDVADITFPGWLINAATLPSTNEWFGGSWIRERKQVGEAAVKQRDNRVRKARDCGLAYLHDSMDFLVFKMGGSTTRTPGQYVFKAHHLVSDTTNCSSARSPSGSGFVTNSKIVTNAEPETSWSKRLWAVASSVISSSQEDVGKLAPVWTSSVIHPSVRMWMMKDPTYDPPALSGFKLMYDQLRDRWTWVKEWTTASAEVRRKKLHEYRISDPSFALSKVTAETLGSGVAQEVPLPPRQPSRSWFGIV
jgi:hypothetical protein